MGHYILKLVRYEGSGDVLGAYITIVGSLGIHFGAITELLGTGGPGTGQGTLYSKCRLIEGLYALARDAMTRLLFSSAFLLHMGVSILSFYAISRTRARRF